MKRIMVCLDGSPRSERALPLAVALARGTGATLQLAHVHVPFFLVYPDAGAHYPYQLDEQRRLAEERHLAALQLKESAAGVNCTYTLLRGETIIGTLVDEVRARECDLMVVTTHGYGPWSRFWLGSVADSIIPVAPCPVLVMRAPDVPPDLETETVIRRIMVPLDGSRTAEAVLEPAFDLADTLEAEVHLVRIVTDSALAAAQSCLEEIARRRPGITVMSHALEAQNAATGLLDAVSHLDIDLIAMETHGWRGLKRLRLGSVADKVLRGASVPMLMHHQLVPAEQPPVSLEHSASA